METILRYLHMDHEHKNFHWVFTIPVSGNNCYLCYQRSHDPPLGTPFVMYKPLEWVIHTHGDGQKERVRELYDVQNSTLLTTVLNYEDTDHSLFSVPSQLLLNWAFIKHPIIEEALSNTFHMLVFSHGNDTNDRLNQLGFPNLQIMTPEELQKLTDQVTRELAKIPEPIYSKKYFHEDSAGNYVSVV